MKRLLTTIRLADPFLRNTTLVLLLLLLGKFLLPLVLYKVPLGYDPGIYRYLFLRYAEAAKTLSLPELSAWATEYPRAFYLAISPLLIVGVPVDVIIGALWNVIPVVLAAVLAWVTAKRSDASTGVAVLFIALLSLPYYDGFVAMYMKVYVSLIFLVLTYHLVDRMSMWFPFTALATVLLHQQTGLVLTLALGIWWLIQLPKQFSHKKFRLLTIVMAVMGLVGLVYYLPQWERAIWSPLKSIFLLRGDNAPAGSFPDASFYIKTTAISLLLGIAGFVRSFQKERGSLWQLSVCIPLVFIVLRLVFYKRFFLLLDFFLMPYAAAMLVALWRTLKGKVYLRGVLVILIMAQLGVSWQVMQIRQPAINYSDIVLIEKARAYLPEDASIIALENMSGTWLRGWIPKGSVGAPGLFDYPNWTYEQWAEFIDGTNAQRRQLLSGLEGEVYFFLSPVFEGYYEERATKVLTDPCLKQVDNAPLLRSLCSS